MVKSFFSLSLLTVFTIIILPLNGQTLTSSSRTNSPSQKGQANWNVAIENTHKAFIENKGQFDGRTNNPETTVLYSVSANGVDIYFTPSGVVYRRDEVAKLTEEEREEMEREERLSKTRKLNSKEKKNKDKEDEKYKTKTSFLEMEWLGSNSKAQIITDNQTTNYFTYPDLKDLTKKTGLKANGFKKITYKNIYPNIDVEYTFPENKEGIKYAFILHPGADASDIKMKYTGAKKLKLGNEGDLKITSAFGSFADHAPVTYKDGKFIESSFLLKNNIVSFRLSSPTNKTSDIIIDPWTTLPTFTGSNSAFDIDWDFMGNVYVYGGVAPYQLMKFNSAGVIQWTFTTTSFTSSAPYYGDFAIDRTNGTAYICEGFNGTAGTGIIKVNTAGTQVGFTPGITTINEMWRIGYNSCTHQGVLGCGNTTAFYQAATFDSSLTTITPLNMVGATDSYIDIALLAIDDTNCYMVTAENGVTSFANTLIKAPLGTLSPTTYTVNSGHHFTEVSSITYTSTNGFSGMAKSKKYLYTYDGARIKRWNPSNGALIDTLNLGSSAFQAGGIAVDGCDNIVIGTLTGVSQYDSTFTFVTSQSTGAATYDVAIGAGGVVLACGNGFVSALSLVPICSSATSFTLSTSFTPSTCAGNDGTATVNVTGTGTYTYNWIPGGQTTETAVNLAPGTYVVMVFDNGAVNCSSSGASIDTVEVTATSGFTGQSTVVTPVTCIGNADGTATVNATGGTSPYTYLWSAGAQTTQSISGLGAGTYSVTVTDFTGCQTTTTAVITTPANALSITLNPTDIFGCQAGSIATTVSGGTSPYTYSWSSGATTQNLTNISSAGNYVITVTDDQGCTESDSATVSGTYTPPPVITSVEVNDSCGNGTIHIHILTNDPSSLFFSWYDSNFNFIQGDSIASDLPPGTYFCQIFDFNFCLDTIITAVVNTSTNNLSSVSSQINPICNGNTNGAAWISSTTGIAPFNYSWNTAPAQTTDSIANLDAGTYICTIGDGSGCTIKDTVIITQPQPFSITTSTVSNNCIQTDGTATASVGGATSPYDYLWNTTPSQTTSTATGLAPGNYNCIVTDANNCKDTVYATVTTSNGGINATAGSDVTIATGTSTTLSATGATLYSWSPSAGLSCSNCASPVATPVVTTDYCVTVSDTNGCFDTACVRVSVEYNGFIVPNSFSPNDDGENDVFFFPNIYTQCFNCKIYNRWGTLIYEWENASAGWNGTNIKNGKKVSDDVYYFILDYCDLNNNKQTVTGFIQLLR